MRFAGWLCLGSIALGVSGCAATARIDNPSPQAYMPARDPPSSIASRVALVRSSWAGTAIGCGLLDPPAPGAPLPSPVAYRLTASHLVRLSRGDVVNIRIQDGDEFNGDYVIGADGTISLPYLKRVRAAGLTEEALAARIDQSLVAQKLFVRGVVRLAVRTVRYSAIQLYVRGAVFQPGLHTINELPADKETPENRATKEDQRRYGDFTFRRTLTAALRVAAGVRPDANVAAIEIRRRGRIYRIDLTGVLRGSRVVDPVLEDGDEVYVPEKGCFQAELAKTSNITPRGIRIYISKVHFGPDARYDERIPYGLRLLQAAILASCIGGPLPTRGHREIVLVSTNPVTGASEVVQRSVEALLRDKDRDLVNPFLMPDDAVACYDSPVVEGVDIATAVNSLLGPVRTLRQIQTGTTN